MDRAYFFRGKLQAQVGGEMKDQLKGKIACLKTGCNASLRDSQLCPIFFRSHQLSSNILNVTQTPTAQWYSVANNGFSTGIK
jgi:hypothetical protein